MNQPIKSVTWVWMGGGGGGGALLDHLILIVGYVSRQAAGQEDPDELEHNTHFSEQQRPFH